MKATINAQTHLTDLSAQQRSQIKQTLTHANPAFEEAAKHNRPTYNLDRQIKLYTETHDGLIIPRGITLPTGIEIDDQRHSHPVTIYTNIELRPYQQRAVKLALHQGGGIIVAPTGAGKTVVAINLAVILGQRCLVLVNKGDLAKQWQGAIKQFTGLECGLIGGGKWQEGGQFTVALTQTLVKHQESFDYGLVIADECHNLPAAQSFAVINRQAAKYRFGLSATPQRRDQLEFMLHAALGDIVAEVEQGELGGAVLPVVVSTVKHDFFGDVLSWGEFINRLEHDDNRNHIIVNSAIKSSRTRGTCVLTATVSHAERLANLMMQHDTQPLLLHGQLPKKIRDQRMQSAADNALIIGTVQLLSEGIDWPHVESIIFASPVSASVDRETPAATRLIQAIGRARRPFKGKATAHVLDIIDNHPLGKSAYRKREAVYRHMGFKIRQIGK